MNTRVISYLLGKIAVLMGLAQGINLAMALYYDEACSLEFYCPYSLPWCWAMVYNIMAATYHTRRFLCGRALALFSLLGFWLLA